MPDYVLPAFLIFLALLAGITPPAGWRAVPRDCTCCVTLVREVA